MTGIGLRVLGFLVMRNGLNVLMIRGTEVVETISCLISSLASSMGSGVVLSVVVLVDEGELEAIMALISSLAMSMGVGMGGFIVVEAWTFSLVSFENGLTPFFFFFLSNLVLMVVVSSSPLLTTPLLPFSALNAILGWPNKSSNFFAGIIVGVTVNPPTIVILLSSFSVVDLMLRTVVVVEEDEDEMSLLLTAPNSLTKGRALAEVIWKRYQNLYVMKYFHDKTRSNQDDRGLTIKGLL